MNKTINSIILATGLLCASSAYSADKNEANKNEANIAKYFSLLEKECGRVGFENNAVICEDLYCNKYEKADCGRKYCIEPRASERWRFIPEEMRNLQLVKRKDTTFPYALSYNPYSIKYKALVFRLEETVKKMMEMHQK